MFQRSKGRHARKRTRWVGPVFAFGALMVQLSAKREMDAVTAARMAGFAARDSVISL